MCGQAKSLDGTNGFTIYGVGGYDFAGSSVSSGDVNGDGYADVLVGAYGGDGPSNSASGTGEVHVVFGIPPPPMVRLGKVTRRDWGG